VQFFCTCRLSFQRIEVKLFKDKNNTLGVKVQKICFKTLFEWKNDIFCIQIFASNFDTPHLPHSQEIDMLS
jgi:hypothetical protein